MEYATQTLAQLKVLAADLNATPTGDKRSKQAWIDAILLVQAQVDTEFEQTVETQEFLSQNPNAEGGFHGDYHSYCTIDNDAWVAAQTPAEEAITAPTSDKSPKASATIVLITVISLLLWTIGMAAIAIYAICKYIFTHWRSLPFRPQSQSATWQPDLVPA
jgi:hypothetical protein